MNTLAMTYLVGEPIHMLCQTREAKAQAQGLNLMHFKWTLAMAYLVGELIHMPYQTREAKAQAQGLI